MHAKSLFTLHDIINFIQGSFVRFRPDVLSDVRHCQRVALSDSTTDEEQDEKRVGTCMTML